MITEADRVEVDALFGEREILLATSVRRISWDPE